MTTPVTTRNAFRVARRVCVLALALAAAGCGFRLAGLEPMPASMATTYIEADDRRALLPRLLADTLTNAGVTIADKVDDDTALLRIIDSTTGQRVLSVTTRGGPEEIEVVHQVRYEVLAGEREIVPPRTLTLTRNYAYDRTDVLGTQEEGENVRQALAEEMATLIVRSIALAQ